MDHVDHKELFVQVEIEFEVDIPVSAQDTMHCVRDIRDYVHENYRRQGIGLPSVAIFERLRCLIASLAKIDRTAVRPETKLSDIRISGPKRAWS